MKKPYCYLMYAGLVPFVFCAVSLLASIDTLPVLGKTTEVLKVYSIVIASFMAGSHWGQHLTLETQWRHLLPYTSNTCAVLLWLSFLTMSFHGFITMTAICFMLYLAIDRQLFKNQNITSEYFKIRRLVTLIVLSTLALAALTEW